METFSDETESDFEKKCGRLVDDVIRLHDEKNEMWELILSLQQELLNSKHQVAALQIQLIQQLRTDIHQVETEIQQLRAH